MMCPLLPPSKQEPDAVSRQRVLVSPYVLRFTFYVLLYEAPNTRRRVVWAGVVLAQPADAVGVQRLAGGVVEAVVQVEDAGSPGVAGQPYDLAALDGHGPRLRTQRYAPGYRSQVAVVRVVSSAIDVVLDPHRVTLAGSAVAAGFSI